MFKIVAYGVRSNEIAYFEKLNKYDYDLNLISEFLTHDNVETAKGSNAVLLRGNCVADEQNLSLFKEWGIKYVFTRTVGYDHIDLEAAGKLGLKVARVPSYSPFAVSELAMTLGMMLLRHTALETNLTKDLDLQIAPAAFSREIHSSTVGIIGTGKIGAAEASLYSGMGAKVLGYDPYPSDYAKQYVEFVTMDELISKSDIISIHVPYFQGQNDNLVDETFLNKVKKDTILVNTARAQLVDHEAVYDALLDGRLGGFATDVLPDEKDLMGKKFDKQFPNASLEKLRKLYPKVLITPHMGSYTSPALIDMIQISYENFHEVLETGKTKNDVELPVR